MAGGGEWEQQEWCRESKANSDWFHEGGNKAVPAAGYNVGKAGPFRLETTFC